jgi:MoxR-like ATPase
MASPYSPDTDYFAELGVYGFGLLQLPLLTALVTEDPLLLIGDCGTGKTYLLNRISEALGLEHRHYNASLVAFDDLVGFPYPDDDRTEVRFLQTSATVWGAESVLIDEISRCKPEHQNRLFSLVHERRVQGLLLQKLRYRWAAMNPCGPDQDGGTAYAGSEPLDPALADRFALVVSAGDWASYDESARRSIADPGASGLTDRGSLASAISDWRSAFAARIAHVSARQLDYATAWVTALNDAGVRISPRRARLLTRNLCAASVIAGDFTEAVASAITAVSLPQPAWGERVAPETLAAAHQLAWQAATLEGDAQWLHRFLMAGPLAEKAKLLHESCPDPDTGSLAVEQLLASETRERAAAFALALYPAAVEGAFCLGAEGVADLARLAGPMLRIHTKVSWREPGSGPRLAAHPDRTRFQRVIGALRGARAARARQLLYWCVVHRVPVADPEGLEKELEACVRVVRSARRAA